ncbi:Laccase domain protein YfiH [Tepidimonas alkaliphilus]|uniref:Purine nucleoside phosphorylase n=1 Tax=Tepidimonas alkaliphilus TaxID=2588942 RepID=A0A554WAE2_9BURK|nr:peptidoglycan editing factor PgeF [Tepidimonas alkaliphilus]TSE20541.1 Laccase domain protein YfiH [Tepidimonas alkaliphilus]
MPSEIPPPRWQTLGPLPGVAADLGPGARGWVSTRSGGVSAGPWAWLNLGDHVGDEPAAVAENRRRLTVALGVRPVFLRQVHGCAVVRVDDATPDGIEADAAWTDASGVACTVLVADCLPVLLATAAGESVAAAHAGWRGLAGQGGRGVLEALAEAWPAVRDPAARAACRVWIGPAIGRAAFEVGDEVRRAFVEAARDDALAFTPSPRTPGRWLADLAWLARARLHRLGFGNVGGHDGSAIWCTVSQPTVFFSHRRDAARLGASGRMAACVWRA